MAHLTPIQKRMLETIFDMGGGYVMTFSNTSFHKFILDVIKCDIYSNKYSAYGDSKGKRLKALWDIEGNVTVGKLTEEMLLFLKAEHKINNTLNKLNKELYEDCLQIAYELQGKKGSVQVKESTEDDFLKIDIDEIKISQLELDGTVTEILEQRIVEIKKCLKSEASLSVIFLCGSVLEGILLNLASTYKKEFNQSSVSPKDKEGKVKQFHEWSLSNFIDVAYELRVLDLDIKKHSHSLRDFRNYIHPFQQMSSGFNPNKHTAEISWKVLKAALYQIKNYIN